MKGKRGFFSFINARQDNEDDKANNETRRRRRRHSSGGDRETWSRKVEYFFASLGYAVGMGNIWRFPYLCYRNGGGAFLIPYLIALVAVGFPIMFLEMAFGQFASLGSIAIWRISPLFKGIGYAIVLVLMLVNTYYNILITYGLFYLFASITDVLPWSTCDNSWNTPNCITTQVDRLCRFNDTNGTLPELCNINRTLLKTPTEEYFDYHLLHRSEGIHDLGQLQWPLIVCLAVSWGTCFMCLFRGIKSMGKVVIFTTIFSYLILTVLLIRGVTLPGAGNGIVYFLRPDFSQLSRLQVWGEASAQAFASLTLGGGGWITLSSYNKFKNRCDKDAIIVGIGNALTSIYGGIVIFSVLGYMADMKGVSVDDVTARGPGLAFVAYPEGLALIPGAPFWSICFFIMMFTVGLDSLFGQVETIVAALVDEYPEYLRPNRRILTFTMCFIMFLFGLPLVTQGGIYIVTLMDWYTLLMSFSIISLFEVMVIVYVYGYERFATDIQMMIGRRPALYFMATWRFLSPITLVCVIAFLAANYVPAYYGDYSFPAYAESIGWMLALIPVAFIPLTMIVQFFLKLGNPMKLCSLFSDADLRSELYDRLVRPTQDWGPALPEMRRKCSYPALPDDDDVFTTGAEMTEVKPEKERLVHFSDSAPPGADDVNHSATEIKDGPPMEEKPSLDPPAEKPTETV